MKLNQQVFDKVALAAKEIVVVTKYYDPETTNKHLAEILLISECIGVGENRTKTLAEKTLPRESTHYIGRIQSRKISEIIKYCQTVHSLCSLKHAQIFNEQTLLPLLVFVQVNVAGDPSKEGLLPDELPTFLKKLEKFSNLKIIGLSSMGWGDFEMEAKRREFKSLIKLRDEHLPKGKTSAGTSRDYTIALEEGIDIVRVGGACFVA